jgi:hypothetical protein
MMNVLGSPVSGSLKTAKAEEFRGAIRSALISCLYAGDSCHIGLTFSSTAAQDDWADGNEVEETVKDIGRFQGGRMSELVHGFLKSGEP